MTRPKGGPPPAGRWCGDHGRHECTRAKHGGGACHGTPARGLDACRLHLGQPEQAAAAAALHAWAAIPGDAGISPMDAAAGQLGLAWRRAEQLGDLLAAAYAAEGAAVLAGPLASAERDERDRVVRYATACHGMGMQETRARLVREAADWLRYRIDDLLERLGVDRRDVGDQIAAWLRDQPPPA